VLPHYAGNFLEWWRDRLRPEIERNFEYLDGFDTEGAGFIELAVLLEDAIDIHDRHWKIHWMLNFAQFASTQSLNALLEEEKGDAAAALMGRLQSSIEDRNWDSIEDLWKMKEEIKEDSELRAAFEGETAADVMGALEGSERGRRFIEERVEPHQRHFGYKAIWSHEFAFKTWREDPAPMIEAVRGYLATDYDYPAAIAGVRDDLEAAKREALEGAEGGELEDALERSLSMNPLTPDHHFYIDQGTNARLRLLLIAIGEKLVEAGTIDDAEDVMFLRYNELRLLMADQEAFDARDLIGDRRDAREDAFEKRPPSWVGTATQTALDFPYNALWGFPEKFHAGEPATTGEVRGLAASAGVVEGPARYVQSLDEFDQVQDGEILVCRMTNPAWVVLFTKIAGLVTEAGGAVSHPAVVAREFGIPAVVGTTNAGDRIATGDRVRVNGTTGVVEILS
jgi:phosphohistidine swiveling domain-containing protein